MTPLELLAREKKLDVEWLRSIGVRDGTGGKVLIDYHAEDESILFERWRLPPGGKQRFQQPEGTSLAPYGLNHLEEARGAGQLVICEGESCAWTLWAAGKTALGMPGAKTSGCLQSEHLQGISDLYLSLDNDADGEKGTASLIKNLEKMRFQGNAYRVTLPEGVKDISDLYVSNPEAFPSLWQALLDAAAPVQLVFNSPKKAATKTLQRTTRCEECVKKYVDEAVRIECDKVAGTKHPGRNNQLNTSAMSLGGLIAASVLDRGRAETELTAAGEQSGLDDRGIRDAIKSGLDDGSKKARDLLDVGLRCNEKTHRPQGAGEASQKEEVKGPVIYRMTDIMKMTFPPEKWVVPGLIGEGLTLLAGKPKLGKSWMALNIALTVAAGGTALGSIKVDAGDVLYLCLEDRLRRVQSRAAKLLAVLDVAVSERLHVSIAWPKSHEKGLFHLEEWIKSVPNPALIIIDVWIKFREPSKNGPQYEQDSHALEELKKLADDNGISILVVHHCKKAPAMDAAVDEISGTLGINGVADGMMDLSRARSENEAKLSVTGRDVNDHELALQFDPLTCCWTSQGDAKKYREGSIRSKVMEVYRKNPTFEFTSSEMADVLDQDKEVVRKEMWRMHRDGILQKVGRKYKWPLDGDGSSAFDDPEADDSGEEPIPD